MPEQDVLEDVEVDQEFENGLRTPIDITAGQKPRMTDEVQDAISRDVFHHDGSLFIVRGGEDGCRMVPLSRESLDDLINRRCYFSKLVPRGRGENRQLVPEDTDAPKWLAENIHGLGDWPRFRELRQVTSVPYLRPDGSIGGLRAGYDESAKCWADVPEGLTPPPVTPTDSQAKESLRKILDVVQEFPFETTVGKSVFLAAVLTILARRSIDGAVPLFVVDASKSGSGKTLLARIIAILGSGSDPGLANTGANEAETRKVITSFLMSGQPVFVLDNQVGNLGGQAIDRLQTSGKWTDRLLNLNRVATLKNDIVTIATSNNAQIIGDTGRRTLLMRLVPNCERPEERVFQRKNLLGHVMQHRHSLAVAALTIIRWHIAKGCPEATVANHVLADGQVIQTPVKPFGSFEDWSRVVRHAVISLGLPDPVATQSAIKELDEQALAERRFVWAFAEWGPTWEGTAEELIRRVYDDNDAAEMRAALAGILGDKDFVDNQPKPTAFGYRLRSIKDRRFGDWALVSMGQSKSGVRWGVKSMAQGGDVEMG
jgi:putative DNA primase/helicase